MTHGVGLAGLPLSIAERAAQLVTPRAADHVERVPELRRSQLVCDVLEHADDLAAADFIVELSAELGVVALLVDRERAIADDRDAAIGRRDEILPREIALARPEGDVRHALKLDIGPGLRIRASMRAGLAALLRIPPGEPRGLLARRLVVVEDPVPDDQKVIRCDAIVIPPGGREPADLGPVAAD